MHQAFLRVKKRGSKPIRGERGPTPCSHPFWAQMDSAGSILDYSGWSVKFAFFHVRIEVKNPPIRLHNMIRSKFVYTTTHSVNISVNAGHHIVTFLTSSVNNMDIPPCGRLTWTQHPHLPNGPSKVCS